MVFVDIAVDDAEFQGWSGRYFMQGEFNGHPSYTKGEGSDAMDLIYVTITFAKVSKWTLQAKPGWIFVSEAIPDGTETMPWQNELTWSHMKGDRMIGIIFKAGCKSDMTSQSHHITS